MDSRTRRLTRDKRARIRADNRSPSVSGNVLNQNDLLATPYCGGGYGVVDLCVVPPYFRRRGAGPLDHSAGGACAHSECGPVDGAGFGRSINCRGACFVRRKPSEIIVQMDQLGGSISALDLIRQCGRRLCFRGLSGCFAAEAAAHHARPFACAHVYRRGFWDSFERCRHHRHRRHLSGNHSDYRSLFPGHAGQHDGRYGASARARDWRR